MPQPPQPPPPQQPPAGPPQQPSQGGGFPPPPAGPPPAGPPSAGPPPTSPPPGPYGQPGQPGQPGYGPYGQPAYGQAPGAYGQPTAGQQQYSPGAPTYPGSQPHGGPGGPGGGGMSRKTLGIVAAVVAVVLIAGLGIWLASGDDSGGGGGTGEGKDGGALAGSKPAKQLFSLKQPNTPTQSVQSVDGGWATPKIYAKSTINAVEGYSMTGKRKWNLPLDGPVCGSSPHMTADNLTAIGVEKGSGGCNTLVVFDVDSGKKQWEKPIPFGDTIFGGGNLDMTVAENAVALSWNGGYVAYDIKGGPPLWKSKETGETCEHTQYGGGTKLLVVLECGSGAKSVTLNRLDPRTGHSTWDVKIPKGIEGDDVHIVDTDPVVLVLGNEDEPAAEVMTVTRSGEIATSFGLGKRYEPGCGLGNLGGEGCFNVAATDDTVFISTEKHEGTGEDSLGNTNEVMGFGFRTGKPMWKSSAGSDREIYPIGTQDGKGIAYKLPTFERGGEVVSVDPKTGKQHGLLRLPDESAEEQGDYLVPSSGRTNPSVYDRGRLFLQRGVASDDGKGKAPLAMGFGPG